MSDAITEETGNGGNGKSNGQSVVAFVNWELPLKDGKSLNSGKGFPIKKRGEYYVNPSEGELVRIAEDNGGSATVMLKVTVRLNTKRENLDLSQVELVA